MYIKITRPQGPKQKELENSKSAISPNVEKELLCRFSLCTHKVKFASEPRLPSINADTPLSKMKLFLVNHKDQHAAMTISLNMLLPKSVLDLIIMSDFGPSKKRSHLFLHRSTFADSRNTKSTRGTRVWEWRRRRVIGDHCCHHYTAACLICSSVLG